MQGGIVLGRVGWKWESLSQGLSSTNLVKLASIALKPEAKELDSFGWLDVMGGRSTVKSAYRMARGLVDEDKTGGLEYDLKVENSEKDQSLLMGAVTWQAPDKFGEVEKEDDSQSLFCEM